jgi:heptosyltransferase III
MFYLMLIFLFKPFLFILSFFRGASTKYLVIQTAKIGDYVNSTVMFDALKKCDILIDGMNLPLAKNDSRVEEIYCIDLYRRTILGKIGLGLKIFWNNYECIYVLVPNNLNLFVSIMGNTKVHSFLHYKTGTTAKSLLKFCHKVLTHTKDNLTISTYLKLVNDDFSESEYKKSFYYKDMPKLPQGLENIRGLNIGIALSAGNKIKELPLSEWEKIILILDEYKCQIHFFGVSSEKRTLDALRQAVSTHNCKFISHLGDLALEALPLAISKMDLFISSDTAGAYMADSYNIPLIVYAGPCYMAEQRPLGARVLIVESNAPCVPFSFIFDAPYKSKCSGLYDTTIQQNEEIRLFVRGVLKSQA